MQDNNDADTLVNMCTCLQYTQKSLDTNAMARYVRSVMHCHSQQYTPACYLWGHTHIRQRWEPEIWHRSTERNNVTETSIFTCACTHIHLHAHAHTYTCTHIRTHSLSHAVIFGRHTHRIRGSNNTMPWMPLSRKRAASDCLRDRVVFTRWGSVYEAG